VAQTLQTKKLLIGISLHNKHTPADIDPTLLHNNDPSLGIS
jgi:hypothetical protein